MCVCWHVGAYVSGKKNPNISKEKKICWPSVWSNIRINCNIWGEVLMLVGDLLPQSEVCCCERLIRMASKVEKRRSAALTTPSSLFPPAWSTRGLLAKTKGPLWGVFCHQSFLPCFGPSLLSLCLPLSIYPSILQSSPSDLPPPSPGWQIDCVELMERGSLWGQTSKRQPSV